MIGSIVMVFVLLFLTIGLVVSVRYVLRRLRDSVLVTRTDGARTAREEVAGRHPLDEAATGEQSAYDEGGSPLTGRRLKAQYLRGEMSKAEYDRRLRALQLDDFLKGRH